MTKNKKFTPQIEEQSKIKSRESLILIIFTLIFISPLLWFVYSVNYKSKNDSISQNQTLGKNLEQSISPQVLDAINLFTSPAKIKQLESSKNLEEALFEVNKDIFQNLDKKQLDKLLNLWVEAIQKIAWGDKKQHFQQLNVEDKLIAIADFLIKDIGFIYSSNNIDIAGQKENEKGGVTVMENLNGKDLAVAPYLVENLFKNGEGNCATFPVVYLIFAHRLGLDSVKLVTVGTHQFCRYDDGKIKFNIETTNPEGMGIGAQDKNYIRDFQPNNLMLENSTTMRSQNLKQQISSLLVTRAAFITKSGKASEKLNETLALSYYFDPNSIYALKNFLDLVKNSKELPNREEIIKELSERGYHLGVLTPKEDKIQKIETLYREILSSHRDLGFQIVSYEKVKTDLKNKLNEFKIAELNEISERNELNQNDFGFSRNGSEILKIQKQNQILERSQARFLLKNKLESEFLLYQNNLRNNCTILSKNIEELLKESHILDQNTILNLQIIQKENIRNKQSLD